MNLGGAKDRVVLSEVWQDVQAGLKDEKARQRANYGTNGFLSLFG